MNRTTVWIDHHKAMIFENGENASLRETYEPMELESKVTKEHLRKFYHEVALKLVKSEKLFILGPGVAKEEFKNHLEQHHPKLGKSVVMVSNLKDHPSENDIKKAAKEFYSKDLL